MNRSTQLTTGQTGQLKARGAPGRMIGHFVPQLTRKAFERYGFATAEIAAEWPTIAGAKLASFTLPEKLKWPRGARRTGETGQRDPATLILRVEPAFALEVQYQTAQIIERLNRHFGYRAVSDIRIVQGRVDEGRVGSNMAKAHRARQTARSPSAAQHPVAMTPSCKTRSEAVETSQRLETALARLEANVCASGGSRKGPAKTPWGS